MQIGEEGPSLLLFDQTLFHFTMVKRKKLEQSRAKSLEIIADAELFKIKLDYPCP